MARGLGVYHAACGATIACPACALVKSRSTQVLQENKKAFVQRKRYERILPTSDQNQFFESVNSLSLYSNFRICFDSFS
jgi:hypothetical protein